MSTDNQELDENSYNLTFQDALTLCPEPKPLSDQKPDTVARSCVTQIMCRRDCPMQILSGRGSNFLSKLLQSVCQLVGIKRLLTTRYRPPCNGMLERTHQSLTQMFAHYVSNDDKN
jgi:hypothetical protein